MNLAVHITEYPGGEWTYEPISGKASEGELPFLHKLAAHLQTLSGPDKPIA